MGKRKRKFSEIHREYRKFKEEDIEIKQLYNQVKREYLEDENLNIYLEKIYLENKINGEKSETYANNMAIIIAIFSSVITIGIEKIMPNDTLGIGITILFVTLESIFILLLSERKKIKGEFNKYLYYKVCLAVIEEIEKERMN